MKRILLFDTAVGSENIGDQIINQSFLANAGDLLQDAFVVKCPTHTPACHFYQDNSRGSMYRYADSCDYKLIIGTNILSRSMLNPWGNWNVNLFNCGVYRNSVLVGCGFAGTDTSLNTYTRMLYRRILSKDYVHSVRDDKTVSVLEGLGLKAINTGCPSMWMLTPEHCSKIPAQKKDNVVFTLTDYDADPVNDQKLIDILLKNYSEVYFWVQGSADLKYLQSLQNTQSIHIVSPNLESFRALLQSGRVDYVGTRLHAGIFAMQNFVRSIIITIDNRARDIQSSYDIVALERTEVENRLEQLLQREFSTNITMDLNRIESWKAQFR